MRWNFHSVSNGSKRSAEENFILAAVGRSVRICWNSDDLDKIGREEEVSNENVLDLAP